MVGNDHAVWQDSYWDNSIKCEWFQRQYLKRTRARSYYNVANTVFPLIQVEWSGLSVAFFFCNFKALNLSWLLSFFNFKLSYKPCFVTVVLPWAESFMCHSCISTTSVWIWMEKCNYGACLLEWNCKIRGCFMPQLRGKQALPSPEPTAQAHEAGPCTGIPFGWVFFQ